MEVSSGANRIPNGVVVAQVDIQIPAQKKRKQENLIDNVSKSCCSIEITKDSLNMCSNFVSTQNDRTFRIKNSSFFIKLCDSCQQLHNMRHFCSHCGMRCQLLDYKECAEGHRTHVDCVQLQMIHDECPHCDKKFIRTRTKQRSRPKPNHVEYQAHKSPIFEFTEDELNVMKQIMINYQDPKQVPTTFTSEQIKRAVDSSNYKLIADVLKSPVESILQPVAKVSLFDYCLSKNRVDLAEVFLRFGLSPNKCPTNGIFSSLLEAAKKDNQRLVQYCLRAGVDPKRTDDNGRTAAHWACSTSSLATVKLLVTPEFIGMQDLTGFTCLHWALENPNFEVFDFVVKKCHAKDLYIADEMGSDKLGKTVLHWAAHYGFSQHCRALMERDENLLSARDASGATAIYYAAQLEEDKAVRTLAEILPFFKEYASLDQNKDPLKLVTGRAKLLLLQIRQNIEVEGRKYRKFKDRMVKWDIADAKESFPIHVFNRVDDSNIPSFTYMKRIRTKLRDLRFKSEIIDAVSCQCKGDCNGMNCVCRANSDMGFFRSDGRLNIDVYNRNQGSSAVAFDCNELCSCDFRTCKNLHLKIIDPKRVEIFRRSDILVGWGLRSATNISRGEFVLPMIGEVIALKNGATVMGDYSIKISSFGGISYFLNQSECANASRFINHSCDHNLVPVRIVRTHDDFRIPSIALFATRNIEKGEELMMNYGDQY
ncbi:unnamed protein product, partial [Oikopleura dioica]